MSTIVAVRKGNRACIAADSLTSFGDTRLSAAYDCTHEKIHRFHDNHIGVVGSAAHTLVIQNLFNEQCGLSLDGRVEIFETFRGLHPKLKEEFFLNPKEEEEDAYESSRIDALIVNPHGVFGIFSLREVFAYRKFWAIGSGAEFALGAMHALYDRLEDADEIARAGVEAGAEFNNASALPISSYSVQLKD